MRWSIWLFVLAACRTQPIPTTPVVTCPVAACPQPNCPACPQLVTRQAPNARDWHCHDMHRPNMPVSGYCRSSPRACESNRQDVIARNVGTPNPCVTQSIAYCFVIVDPITMNRQRACARTLENCKRRRDWLQNNKLEQIDNLGMCAPTANIDRFPFEDERPPTDPRAIEAKP